MKKRLEGRKRATGLGTAAVDALRELRDGKPADETQALFEILEELVRAISLIRTAKMSLEHCESSWDEITTLEAGIKMLRRVDVALNNVADGRPSGITPEDDATDDGGDE
jgi:hypothetical protein